MKKILFLLVALMFAAPAFASVDITIAQDAGNDCIAIISFDASSEPNLVRAFALDISADNDANIIGVTLLSTDYVIHPGTIVIDTSGNVTDYGTPVAPESDLPSDTLGGIGTGGVTIEMASLYAPVGPSSPNAPAPSGQLVSVEVDKECTLTIAANVSRAGSTGVVMESPDEVVTVNLPAGLSMTGCNVVSECLKDTSAEYTAWDSWGKPDCWCYKKQCKGDINGALFLGKPVTLADLNTFKLAFNLTDVDLVNVTDGICADLNHAAFLGKRVTLADLNTFKAYFNLADASVPCCDADEDCVLDAGDKYNFWTN
jgi:hypothetical protein